MTVEELRKWLLEQIKNEEHTMKTNSQLKMCAYFRKSAFEEMLKQLG